MDLSDCIGRLGYGATRWEREDLCTREVCPFFTECSDRLYDFLVQHPKVKTLEVSAKLGGVCCDFHAHMHAMEQMSARVIAANALAGVRDRRRVAETHPSDG